MNLIEVPLASMHIHVIYILKEVVKLMNSEFFTIFSNTLDVQNTHQPRMSNSSRFVKKFHELRGQFLMSCKLHFRDGMFTCIFQLYSHQSLYATVQKKGYVDLQEVAKEDNMPCSYGSTLQKDPNCALPCSWGAADPSSFLIRGPNYLRDHEKVFYFQLLLILIKRQKNV